MTRDIGKRLGNLKSRRSGTDRLDRLSAADGLQAIAKSLKEERYVQRAPSQKYTQYAIGAMQPVDAEYTRISIEEAERVGNQLNSGLAREGVSVGFRLQGSVPCDVHIRGVSDVDLLVLDEGFFTYDSNGHKAQRGDFNSPISYTPLSALLALRGNSERILKDKFPAAKVDTTGGKAIKLTGGSLRRPVDVVPSHWHDTADYQRSSRESDRGVRILDKTVPESVLNMPFRHIERITQSDILARTGLKKSIRLAKNVKADAVEEGGKINLPSFDIAAALWHADAQALASGWIYELAIVAEATRHFDYLARNPAYAKSLLVPDGSRAIFNTQAKFDGLIQLSLEMDDLALQISREQDRALQYMTPSQKQIDEVLRKAMIPA